MNPYLIDENVADAQELIGYPDPAVYSFLRSLPFNYGRNNPIDNHYRDKLAEHFGPILEKFPNQILSKQDLLKLNNITNMPEDNITLDALVSVSGQQGYKEAFVKEVTVRDRRDCREREFPLEPIIEAVENETVRPPLVFELNDARYLIDGRTRIYAAIAANKSLSVKLVNSEKFKEAVI